MLDLAVSSDDFVQTILKDSTLVFKQIESLLATISPSILIYQGLLVIGLFAIAHILSRMLTRRVTRWLDSDKGWPKWQVRFLTVCNQRWRPIIFVNLLWMAVATLQPLSEQNHTFLLTKFSNLCTAWLVISIGGLLIRNRPVRRILVWVAWVMVTLQVLGILASIGNMLDAVAFRLGTIRISLLILVQATVGTIILIGFTNLLLNTLERKINESKDFSPSIKVLFVKLIKIALYSLVFIVGAQSIGFDLTTLTVLSGAIGLGLGFGLQKIVSNLVAGFILLMDKSIKPGDVISLGDTFGWITVLGARYASVSTRDGTEYLIPNEDLITGQVVNWSHTHDLVRLEIQFGVTYDADPHAVRQIAIQALRELDRVNLDPGPVCHVTGFGESSVDYVLRFWIKDPSKGLANIRGMAFLALWDALKENNIEIPYPRRDLRLLPGEGAESIDVDPESGTAVAK